ncbi:YbaB/EbfC family nucleoid-associated protein [Microtetraspora malaysiensis]|uniref:YbaB/EbfC family nucleoid-associated protein n=1 Tax=Microtetraspora malaysiensis TaxID=161358 RepID=UPI00082A8ED2|nr:YbaB/EbfC family nucleoid-associated protein [Microtetraspora malaysiensis]
MADAFEVGIRELAAEINQQMTRVREAYGELSVMEHTARSADGMVSVTVGRHGQLLGLKLNPRVYRSLSASQLADVIMQEVNKATAAVSEQSKQLLQPLMPESVPYEEAFGEQVMLDAFFPKPVEPTP